MQVPHHICVFFISKLKRRQDNHQLSLRVRSVLTILKVANWFCVRCRDDFIINQKCCPNYHEGIWCIPAGNVTDKH
ncbi:putative zinc ribbon protein [Providencia rettgeri]|nr:hypothetical protein [Providencia rettgeri]